MKLLGIETSSSVFSVGVSENGRMLSCLEMVVPERPSSLLSEMMQQALEEAKLSFEQLDGFAVGIGPGSFTGLRVGVMTVKTMAWVLKKPILPISSLELIARNLNDSLKEVMVFVDARKGKVYSALFAPEGRKGLKRVTEDQLLIPEEALDLMEGPAIVVGDGILRYEKLLQTLQAKKVEAAPQPSWIPRVEELCQKAAQLWPIGKVDDPHRLVPKYLYSQESDITGW